MEPSTTSVSSDGILTPNKPEYMREIMPQHVHDALGANLLLTSRISKKVSKPIANTKKAEEPKPDVSNDLPSVEIDSINKNAVGSGPSGGALAFNVNELNSLKKGTTIGAGAVSTMLIGSLVQTLPTLIASVNEAIKNKKNVSGSGSVSEANDVSIDDLKSLLKDLKSMKLDLSSKRLEPTGSGFKINSDTVKNHAMNAWNKLKKFWNSDSMTGVRNSLTDFAKNYTDNLINNAAEKVSSKTENEYLKNAIEGTRSAISDAKNAAIDSVSGSGANEINSNYDDTGDIEDNVVIKKKSTKILRNPSVSSSITNTGRKLIRANLNRQWL